MSVSIAELASFLDGPRAYASNGAAAPGYGSPSTFSTAFKRTDGAIPRNHRDGATSRTAWINA